MCRIVSACHLFLSFIALFLLIPHLEAESNPLGYDYVRTEVQNTFPQDQVLAYDPNSQTIYFANLQLNRIDVISLASHSVVKTIDVPQPTSVDVSADGTKLIIGTSTQYFYTADPASGQLTGRFTFMIPVPNQNITQPISPVGVTYMSDGTALVMSRNSQCCSAMLLLWDPVSNSVDSTLFSNVIPSFTNNASVSRSGDHKKALIIASSKVQLYDAASKSIEATRNYSSATPLYAVLNGDGSRIFVGVNTFNSQSYISALRQSLIEDFQVAGYGGQPFALSPDALKVYFHGPCCVFPAIPTIKIANTDPNSSNPGQPIPQGSLPDLMFGQTGSTLTLAETTETGVLLGITSSGIGFIDTGKAALFNGPANVPVPGFFLPNIFTPAAGALNLAISTTTTAGTNFTPMISASFGSTLATSITPILGQTGQVTGFNITAPPSSQPGPVNFVAKFDSNWTSIVPLAFTYGPKIVKVRTSGGASGGGNRVSIIGYGLGDLTNNPPTVKIGGADATVQSVQLVPQLDNSSPLQEIIALSPLGSGKAAVSVSNTFGSDTVPDAFTYVDIQSYPKTGPLNFLLYDQGRKIVFASNSSKIERFDVLNKQFLSALQPSTVVANTVFQGLALSPDGTKLIAADSGANLVHIIDLGAGTAAAVDLTPFTIANGTSPQRVAALSNGRALITLQTFGNCQSCFLILNLADKTLVPLSNPAFNNFFGTIDLVGTPDGSQVLLGDGLLYDAVDDFVITGPAAGVSAPYSMSSDARTYFGSNVAASLPDFKKQILLSDSTLLQPGSSQTASAMNPSGGLVYKSYFNPFGTGDNAIDLWDTNTGRLRLRLALTETLKNPFGLQREIVIDESGSYVIAATDSGLTLLHLDSPPLSIGHLTPSVVSNAAGETVTVLGSGFQQGTTLQIGSSAVAATFVDDRTLTFANPGMTVGSYPVKVTNPNGESYTLQLGFTSGSPNPAPRLDSISPTGQQVLDPFTFNQALTLTLNGANFISSSIVMWNGNSLPTAFIDSTHLTATVPTSLLSRAGIARVAVFNPLPDGGLSAFAQFSITTPAPTITTQTPVTLFTNSGNQFFSLNGTGFVSQSVIYWDGTTALQTFYNGSTALSTSVPASLLATPGTHQITVVNPAPGGGTSNALQVNVVVPPPKMNVSQTFVFFFTVAIGRSAEQTLFISPGTSTPLQIGNTTVSGADFTIKSNSCTNLTLQLNQSCQIVVRFTPSGSGTRIGSLSISSNDPTPPTINLSGTGDIPPVINLSVVPVIGPAPLKVTASTAGSSDADGSITQSRIDFGDGTLVFGGAAFTATHTYTNSGTFTVTASVSDNLGLFAVRSALVTVGKKSVRGDFDGDGKADIFWRNQNSGLDSIWFMSGATVRTNPLTLTVDPQTGWNIAGIGDFDGDGKTDILWRNDISGLNSIWLMDGATVRASPLTLTVDPQFGWKIAGIGDFDGDGKADILWRNDISGLNSIWLMDGATVRADLLTLTIAPQFGWKIAGVGDFDGDGKADILWRNDTTGQNSIWLMDGATVRATPLTLTVDPQSGWKIAGVGDFDGDGETDILWRNGTTGQNSIWLMDGATVRANLLTLTVAPQFDWSIAGIGDFDGDGKSDILWRNNTSGLNSMWFMSGAAVLSNPLTLTVSDLTWRIQSP